MRIKNNLMNGGIFDLPSKCFDPIMNKYFMADDSNLAPTCYIKTIKKLLLYLTDIIWYHSLATVLIIITNSAFPL